MRTITTQQAFDRASRLISQTDDGGSATEYGYDAQGRRLFVKNADGTVKHFWYARSGALKRTRDERQVVAMFTHDKLGLPDIRAHATQAHLNCNYRPAQ